MRRAGLCTKQAMCGPRPRSASGAIAWPHLARRVDRMRVARQSIPTAVVANAVPSAVNVFRAAVPRVSTGGIVMVMVPITVGMVALLSVGPVDAEEVVGVALPLAQVALLFGINKKGPRFVGLSTCTKVKTGDR